MAVIAITPRVFEDARGWFSETYHQARLAEIGIDAGFCQDNQSLSRKAGTVRGLHFQTPPHAQAKLVRCIRGRLWDVAVDARAGSPTYGKWVGAELTAANRRQLFIPAGFLHGFVTLEDDTEIAYKCSDFYDPACDAGIRWDDPMLAIAWPLDGRTPILSEKDASLPGFNQFVSPFAYDGRPLTPLGD